MRALVIGSGRVGSALAKRLADAGWDVAVVDETELALDNLGGEWRGGFVVGHGMEPSVLEEAGIAEADVVVAATDGDNTNLVVAQVAKLRYDVARVAARVYDPARAEFYAGRGFEIVSPARAAIEQLSDWALAQEPPD